MSRVVSLLILAISMMVILLEYTVLYAAALVLELLQVRRDRKNLKAMTLPLIEIPKSAGAVQP